MSCLDEFRAVVHRHLRTPFGRTVWTHRHLSISKFSICWRHEARHRSRRPAAAGGRRSNAPGDPAPAERRARGLRLRLHLLLRGGPAHRLAPPARPARGTAEASSARAAPGSGLHARRWPASASWQGRSGRARPPDRRSRGHARRRALWPARPAPSANWDRRSAEGTGRSHPRPVRLHRQLRPEPDRRGRARAGGPIRVSGDRAQGVNPYTVRRSGRGRHRLVGGPEQVRDRVPRPALRLRHHRLRQRPSDLPVHPGQPRHRSTGTSTIRPRSKARTSRSSKPSGGR